MSHLRALRLTMAACVFAVTAAACSSDPSSENTCRSSIANYSSPATGALTLTGNFYANESILIRDGAGRLLASGTPASDRTAFTLTGLQSGTQTLTVIASCDAGQRQIDQGAYTIK
jgi:hypothetical protein